MKLSGLLLLALLILAIADAGCVGFVRDTYKGLVSTPSPSASAVPSSTPTPINQTVERQYMFREKLVAGYEDYNAGIQAFNASKAASDRSDWDNATQQIGMAKSYMDQSRADFLDIKPYALTPDEILVSVKWNDTAYYQGLAFDFVNLSYQEAKYQASRSFAEQNPIKYNFYVSQANDYIALARQSRAEAEAAESRTFIGQPVP